jgi:glycosyltransferase involved in cell wall biosynthesis
MKIVYLHQYFTTPKMAGGTRSYEMARRLASNGHEVHMVTTRTSVAERRGLPRWDVEVIDGIHVHWLPVRYGNRMTYRRRMLAFAIFALFASRRARQLRGEVVFATSTPLTIALPALAAIHGTRTPMVFEVRDLWPQLPIAVGALNSPVLQAAARTLERETYRRASAVVALSPEMVDGVVAVDGKPDKVTLIPNSCDNDLFEVPSRRGEEFRAARPWLGDGPIVIYAGTLGYANGVSYLVRIARECRAAAPQVRFLVLGDGAEADAIRRLADSEGVLGRNFFMEPFLPKERVPDALSAATVCTSVFRPIRELQANSPNKVFDALAAGRPIAVNHEGWIADLVREHRLGAVLDPHDPAAAASELVALLDDHEALRLASQAAKRLALGPFSRDRLAHQLEAVLTSVKEPELVFET